MRLKLLAKIGDNQKIGINDRQKDALLFLINNSELYNSNYQLITGSNKRTASRELRKLVDMNILKKHGKGRGRGTYYTLIDFTDEK